MLRLSDVGLRFSRSSDQRLFPLAFHYIATPRKNMQQESPPHLRPPRIKFTRAADSFPSLAGIVNTPSVLFNHGRVVLEPLYHFAKALLERVFRMPTQFLFD